MDKCLLKNILADNAGPKPASLKFAANPRKKQPVTITASNTPPTDTGKTATTDNSQLTAQNKPINPASNNFSHTLGKKIMTKTSLNAQLSQLNKGKNKEQNQNSGTLPEMTHPAIAMIQGQLTQSVVLDKAANVKSLNQLQQQEQSQTHGKTVRANQNQIKSKLTLQAASEGLLAANAQSEKGKNTEKQQAFVPEGPKITEPNKTATTSTFRFSLQNQQSGKEVTSQTLQGNNKTTLESEQSTGTNKPSAPVSSETQLSNQTFAGPANQSSQQQQMIGQESHTLIAEESKPGKADAGQKKHRGKTELFGLLEKNNTTADNPSVKFMAQKMSRAQVQSFGPQTENNNNSFFGQGPNPNTEPGKQIFVGGNSQPDITEPSPTSTASTKIAGNANSSDSIGEQIQESIHSSFRTGNQQIVVRLNPPELGKVAIKFTEQDDNITGLLQVDKTQTRDQIQQVLPEIIQNLQNSGISIEKLEVALTNQQGQQALKDQSSTAGQDSWAEQQSSPNPESQGNNTSHSDWLTNIDNVHGYMEPQMQLADNSINMLI